MPIKHMHCRLLESMHRVVLFSLFSIILTACGFQPLYQQRDEGAAINTEFSHIEVAPIPNRLGQVMHNVLLDRLNPHGTSNNPEYRLVVTVTQQKQGFGFQEDSSVTRENLRLEAHYQLILLESNESILSGVATSNMTYDLVASDFANLTANQDALNRTTEQAVNTIVTRLGFFFRSRESH